MLRLAADENFNNIIIRGLLRRNLSVDIVRLQDTNLSGADDPTVLEWAAETGRVLLTHDTSTMPRHAYERVRAGMAMSGIFAVRQGLDPGQVIEDLALLVECSLDDEWNGQVQYLPLR